MHAPTHVPQAGNAVCPVEVHGAAPRVLRCAYFSPASRAVCPLAALLHVVFCIHVRISTPSPPCLPCASYEKCEYELYIERVKEFAKLRKQQLLVSPPLNSCAAPSLTKSCFRRNPLRNKAAASIITNSPSPSP
jgi:hypothetical protein